MGGTFRIPGVLSYGDAGGKCGGWTPPAPMQSARQSDESSESPPPVCTRRSGLIGLDPLSFDEPHSTEQQLKEAARELYLLRRVYGRIADKHNQKDYRRKDPVTEKRVDDVDDYLFDRTQFFGADYATFRAETLAELAAVPRLRAILEPNAKERAKHAQIWEEAQTTFYCWVRKAMLNHLAKTGRAGVSAPTIILSGMTEELQSRLKAVRAEYKGDFKSGGYNPRPMKANKGYRLGTISEHGFGLAVDVNSALNAHIGQEKRWHQIQLIAGTHVSQATRKSWWKSDPRRLFDNIVDTSQNFVTALNAAKAAAEEAGHTGKATIPAVMEADTRFRLVGDEFLKRWPKGFFTLDWHLVNAFHNAGFTWGAVFSTADLHHFEID
ncbi:MAG TPA: hypothetical protein VK176_10900 [Phycisphaerales bacterium]|nr:hypothetical protein [Phycisphaerales bacterium]